MTEKNTLPLAITADQIGIKAVTLRRWCEYHASYLSPGANPPTGQARRFNGRDIEVLKTVRDLREDGFSSARINEKLSGLTFAEIDTSESIPADSEDTAVASVGSQEGLQQAPAFLVAVQDLQRQIDAIQQANQEANRSRIVRLRRLLKVLLSLILEIHVLQYLAVIPCGCGCNKVFSLPLTVTKGNPLWVWVQCFLTSVHLGPKW